MSSTPRSSVAASAPSVSPGASGAAGAGGASGSGNYNQPLIGFDHDYLAQRSSAGLSAHSKRPSERSVLHPAGQIPPSYHSLYAEGFDIPFDPNDEKVAAAPVHYNYQQADDRGEGAAAIIVVIPSPRGSVSKSGGGRSLISLVAEANANANPEGSMSGAIVDASVIVAPKPLRRVIFVPAVALSCVILFILEMKASDWTFDSMNDNPMVGPSATAMLDMGAKYTPYILNNGEWWRLVTPIFLHAGIIHLCMNMLVLLTTVRQMEQEFGAFRIAAIFFIGGVFGEIISAIFMPSFLSVGASGALYACIGGLLGDFIHNYQYFAEGKWKYLATLIIQIVIGFVIGLMPLVDNFCHLGGLIGGFLASLIFLSGSHRDGQHRRYKPIVVICAAILLAAGYGVSLWVLRDRVDAYEYCSWCTYISCVDTPWWTCPNLAQLNCNDGQGGC